MEVMANKNGEKMAMTWKGTKKNIAERNGRDQLLWASRFFTSFVPSGIQAGEDVCCILCFPICCMRRDTLCGVAERTHLVSVLSGLRMASERGGHGAKLVTEKQSKFSWWWQQRWWFKSCSRIMRKKTQKKSKWNYFNFLAVSENAGGSSELGCDQPIWLARKKGTRWLRLKKNPDAIGNKKTPQTVFQLGWNIFHKWSKFIRWIQAPAGKQPSPPMPLGFKSRHNQLSMLAHSNLVILQQWKNLSNDSPGS